MTCQAMHDWTELSWWRVLKKCDPLEKRMATQYSCLENPMNSMKRQKDMTLKDEPPRALGAQYATREEWRINSRKNRETVKAKTTPSCGYDG